MSVAIRSSPNLPFFQPDSNGRYKMQQQPNIPRSAGDISMNGGTPGRQSFFPAYSTSMKNWPAATNLNSGVSLGATKEAKKRRDLKMRVVTQPSYPSSSTSSSTILSQQARPQVYQRGQRQVISPRRGPRVITRTAWKERLPREATELLAKLYEALIMAKNCEVSSRDKSELG
jgi:hypothetical protein